jgi:plastocyanin
MAKMKTENLRIFWILIVASLAAMALVTACGDDDDDDDDDADDGTDDDATGDDDDDDDDEDDTADDDTADDDDNDDTAPQTSDVTIAGLDMSPDPVEISVGDTVRWTNQESVAHTVTSGSPGDGDVGLIFDSGNLLGGDSFSFTFDDAGTFTYFCQIHSGTMFGYQVIVTE